MNTFSLAIHGGAGTILKEEMTQELEANYTNSLQTALNKGYEVLAKNGTSIDAVAVAVACLEDNPLFNAGKGAVFTKTGRHELDAAIMCGKTLEAGAVAGVRNVRNPVILANEIRLHSGHVLLMGKGANDFAMKQGVAMEPDEYFYTKFRHDQWVQIRDSDFYQLDHKGDKLVGGFKDKKFGTVGAVACDVFGNIAAATSTGGMTNKKYGRVGDSPLIGAGTYANNKTCGISCTGHGELFIRAVTAYDISCLMEYKGLSLLQACDEVVNKKLVAIGGEGGVIGIDAQGNTCMIFNSAGMYRGAKNSNGYEEIKIYK